MMTVVFWDKQKEEHHIIEDVTCMNMRRAKINGCLLNVWELFVGEEDDKLTLKQRDFMLVQVYDF